MAHGEQTEIPPGALEDWQSRIEDKIPSEFDEIKQLINEIIQRQNEARRGQRDSYKSYDEALAKLMSPDIRMQGFGKGKDTPKPGELWELKELGPESPGYLWADELADAAYYLTELHRIKPDEHFDQDLQDIADAFHYSVEDLLKFAAVKYLTRLQFNKNKSAEQATLRAFWEQHGYAGEDRPQDLPDLTIIDNISARHGL